MMMNELKTVTSSWRDQIPAAVAAEADQWQGKITVAVNAAVVTAGQALRAMKAQMPHGCFEQWWRDELKLKDSKMVSDLMAASEVLEGQPEVTPLSDLPARTLGILNRGGPEAVTKAVKRLEQGERITEAKAREIVKPNAANSPEMADPWSPSAVPQKVTKEEIISKFIEGRQGMAAGFQGIMYEVETPVVAGKKLLEDWPEDRRQGALLMMEEQMRVARLEAICNQVEKLRKRCEEHPEDSAYLQMRITPLMQEAELLSDQSDWFEEHVLPTLDDA